jgi:hypothetical protein
MKKSFWVFGMVLFLAMFSGRAAARDEYEVREREDTRFQAASFSGGGSSNQFPRIKGTYNGLIAPTNEFVAEYSGFFTISVGSDRRFHGWMNVGDRRYPLRGRFDFQGNAGLAIYRRDWDDCFCFYTLRLIWLVDLRLIAGTDEIEGTVDNVRRGWNADLFGYRGYGAVDGPAVEEGRYTLRLPGNADPAVAPGGEGYGVVKVSSKGKVTMYGALPDGLTFSRSAVISTNGWWPFYLPFNDGRGALIGWLNFSLQPGSDVAGDLTWAKPRNDERRYYPDGFFGTVNATGARYTPPASTALPLSWSNGVFRISGGNVPAPATNDVILSFGGKLADNGGGISNLSFSLSRSTGIFRGKFLHPASGRRVSYAGILDQLQDLGAGCFLGLDQGGLVRLEPVP